MPTAGTLNFRIKTTGIQDLKSLESELTKMSKSALSGGVGIEAVGRGLQQFASIAGGIARQMQMAAGGVVAFNTALRNSADSNSTFLKTAHATTKAYKEMGLSASTTRKEIGELVLGQGTLAKQAAGMAKATYELSAAMRAEVAALSALNSLDAKYVATLAQQILLEDAGAQAIIKKTAAINAQMVAYQRLNASGKIGSYDSGTDYVKTLEVENRAIAIQEKGLAALATQMATLKVTRAGFKEGDYAAELLKENRAIESQDAILQHHIATLKATETAERSLQAATNQGIAESMRRNYAGRDALALGRESSNTSFSNIDVESVAKYDAVTKKLLNAKEVMAAFDAQMGKTTTVSKGFFASLFDGEPATAKLGKGFDDLTKKGSGLHDMFRGAAGGAGTLWLSYGQMLPMLAGFATIAGTIKAVKLGTEFDYTTRMIQALSDESVQGAAGLESIRDALLGIQDVSHVPSELASGLLELSRAGVEVQDGIGSLAEISRFATISQIDLGKAVELLVGQTKSFRDVDMAGAANIIAKVADDTSTSIEQMTEAFKNTTELGTVMGFKFADVATALGVMADRGVRAATAGTSLRTSMLQLISPTEAAKKAMKAYFVDFTAIDPITGKVKDLKTMMTDLYKATAQLSSGQRAVVFEKLIGNRSIKAVGALTDAIRDEENQLKSADGAVSKHGKTWDELGASVKKSIGNTSAQVTYLQELNDKMAKSGQVQLQRLKADFEKLFIKATEMEDVTQAFKDFRDIVNDPATLTALRSILTMVTELASLAMKTIVITVEVVKSAFSSGATAYKAEEVGASAGMGSGSEQGFDAAFAFSAKILEEQRKLDSLIAMGATKGSDAIKQAEAAVKAATDSFARYKESIDAAGKAGTEAGANIGMSVDEASQGIKTTEARIKSLQKQLTTGRTSFGFKLDEGKIAYAKTELEAAKKQLEDFKVAYNSAMNIKDGGQAAKEVKELGDAAVETAGRVATQTENMLNAALLASSPAIKQWEAGMVEAASLVKQKLMDSTSDVYEPPMTGEEWKAYTDRIDGIAAAWDKANRAMNEADRKKAVLKDLKPAADRLKQLASDRAQMEAIFAEEKANLDKLSAENQKAYDLGLKNHSEYLTEKNRLNEQALTTELGLKEAAVREAQAAFEEFTIKVGVVVEGEELVGRQIELQRALATAEKEAAEVRGKLQSDNVKVSAANATAEIQHNAAILQAQANVLQMKGEIFGEDSLILEATLKRLEAETLLLGLGDKELNAIKLQAVELKKIEATSTSVWDSMQKGMRESKYDGLDMARDIERATVKAFDSMTDALTDFIMTGKFNFNDLANSIIADITRIVVKASITGPIAEYLTTGSSTALNTGTASALPSGTSLMNMVSGSAMLSGSEGLTASITKLQVGLSESFGKIGFEMGEDFVNGLDTAGFGGISAGLLTSAMALFQGDNLGTAAAKGAISGGAFYAGTALSGGNPLVGAIASLVASALGGGLFDNGPDTFRATPLATNLGVNYDREKGMIPTNYEFTGGDTDSKIYAAMSQSIISVQNAFNEQVDSLVSVVPQAVADQMLDALSKVDFKAQLYATASQEWDVEQAEEALTTILTEYTDAMFKSLGVAYGNALSDFITEKGAEGLVGNNSVWSVLTEKMKANIESAFTGAAATIKSGDVEGGLSVVSNISTAIGQIGEAMKPLQEIVDTEGLSAYALDLRDINAQFDAYSATLKAAGVDLTKYTQLEEARAITIQKKVTDKIAEVMAPIEEIISTSGLSDFALEISEVNTEFDEYRATLDEVGASLDKYTQLEEARVITLDALIAKQRTLNEEEMESAGSTVRDILTDINSQVQSFQDAYDAEVANVGAIKTRVSEGFWAAQDEYEAALQAKNDLLRVASDELANFNSTIEDFLNSIDPTKSSNASLANLKELFSVTATAAKGGDTEAQDKLLTYAQSVLDRAEATSTSAIDYARTEAFVRTQLTDVRDSNAKLILPAGSTGEVDSMVEAQDRLDKATKNLEDFTVLALTTGSETDRKYQDAGDTVVKLTEDYNAAVITHNEALTNLQEAFKLTEGLVMPTNDALGDLKISLGELVDANSEFVSAILTMISSMTGSGATLAAGLGLSGDPAKTFTDLLSSELNGKAVLETILGMGTDEDVANLGKQIGLTGEELTAFQQKVEGLDNAGLSAIGAFDGLNNAGIILGGMFGVTGKAMEDFVLNLKNISFEKPEELKDISEITREITADYAILFGRLPKADELKYWEELGATGETLFKTLQAGAQDYDVESARQRGFTAGSIQEQIESAYRVLFDAIPNEADIKYWSEQNLVGNDLFKTIRRAGIEGGRIVPDATVPTDTVIPVIDDPVVKKTGEYLTAIGDTATNLDTLKNNLSLTDTEVKKLIGDTGSLGVFNTSISTGGTAVDILTKALGTENGSEGLIPAIDSVNTSIDNLAIDFGDGGNDLIDTVEEFSVKFEKLTKDLLTTTGTQVTKFVSSFSVVPTAASLVDGSLRGVATALDTFAAYMGTVDVSVGSGGGIGSVDVGGGGFGYSGSIADQVKADYAVLLGKLPTAADMTYWTTQGFSGATLFETIRKAARENGNLLPGFAVGSNYIPNDMIAQLHQGEKITPKPYVDLERSERNETNSLLKELRNEIAAMKRSSEITAANTKRTSDTLVRVSRDGESFVMVTE